jgi:two-component system sensor histidine kinase and response regulator WspE
MSDDSMIELFRQEAQTQVAILTQGLLILETNSQSESLRLVVLQLEHCYLQILTLVDHP